MNFKHSAVILLVASTFVLSMEARVHAQSQGELPSMDDSFAALVIGDVRGLVDGASAIVNQVMPGMGEMVPAQAGGVLGDPGLTAFGPGDGIAAVVFPGDLVVVIAEAAPDQHEAYTENAVKMGAQAVSVGDLLVVSEDEKGIEIGKKIAGEVQSALLAEGSKASLHALVNVQKVLETYQSEIDSFLEEFPKTMETAMAEAEPENAPPKGLTNILEAEVFGAYQLISQLEIFEVELTPAKEGIGLELTFMPEPGTNLATLLVDSKGGDARKLTGMIPSDGAIRAEGAYDGKALNAFFKKELPVLFEKLNWTEEEKKEIQDLVDMSLDLYGTGFALSMLLERPESTGFLNGYYLYEVADPTKAVDLFREFGSGMGPMGFMDMYEDLGMKVEFEFEENVKTHAGIPVHRMSQKIEAVSDEAKEASGVLSLFSDMDSDIAVIGDHLVVAVGGVPIEEAIDLVQSGGGNASKELASRQHFGEGGTFYVDLHIDGYLRMSGTILQKTPGSAEEMGEVGAILESVQSVFKDAPPIVKSMFADPEKAKAKLFIPSALIQRGSQAVMGAMMGAAVQQGN